MEKDKQTQKTKNKIDFISAIATNTSLNSLIKPEIQEQSIINKETENNSDQNKEIVKETRQINKAEVDEQKQELTKKIKNSKNYKEFIEKILKLHEEKYEKTKEKTSLHTTPQLHYKLKLLAFSSNVNLLDLTNAILTSFFEDNKEDIEVLIKKMSV